MRNVEMGIHAESCTKDSVASEPERPECDDDSAASETGSRVEECDEAQEQDEEEEEALGLAAWGMVHEG